MNNEKEVFYKAKNGSKIHLKYLIENNYPIVFKYVYSLTFKKELSEDVAQETCVRFLENISKFEYKSKTSTLMITIAGNLLKDMYKKNNRIRLESELNMIHEADETSEAKEILMAMDLEYRKLFVLKYYYGYNYNEIGKILGIKEGTVKSRFHYAIKNIREEIFNDE
ncbi:MAG: sigma-70 family RNA polymerase sigma factor [Clostridiales bacterium]|nr:sigma-70 family RNA polymerase sigma factor [Clostridiales bacterium]